jgi:hypothetical protein
LACGKSILQSNKLIAARLKKGAYPYLVLEDSYRGKARPLPCMRHLAPFHEDSQARRYALVAIGASACSMNPGFGGATGVPAQAV